jgi:hypothetical protein
LDKGRYISKLFDNVKSFLNSSQKAVILDHLFRVTAVPLLAVGRFSGYDLLLTGGRP